MRILLTRSPDLISRLIRWQTRGRYSHAAVQLSDNTVIEAWHKGGVVQHNSLKDFIAFHAPTTLIHSFEIRGMQPEQAQRAEGFLRACVGKGYDFRSVFRFMSRAPASVNQRWFCSELAAQALTVAESPLLHAESHHISPRDLAMSPYLFPTDTRDMPLGRKND
jgi:uncharacterized protein YycO